MIPVVITWLRANTTAVSALHTALVAGSLAIDGSMAGNAGVAGVSFVGLKQFRVISLTSASNNSAINFTINGTYFGKAVSQTISGPNANTVSTTQLFETVTSITYDGAITAVSAGIGATGRLNWVLYNYQGEVPNLGVQVSATGSAGSITCSFISTLDDVITIATPVTNAGIVTPDGSGTVPFVTVLGTSTAMNANTHLYATSNQVYRYYTLLISAQSSDFNGNLITTFIQQGIK